jgi:hypothetical protein
MARTAPVGASIFKHAQDAHLTVMAEQSDQRTAQSRAIVLARMVVAGGQASTEHVLNPLVKTASCTASGPSSIDPLREGS